MTSSLVPEYRSAGGAGGAGAPEGAGVKYGLACFKCTADCRGIAAALDTGQLRALACAAQASKACVAVRFFRRAVASD